MSYRRCPVVAEFIRSNHPFRSITIQVKEAQWPPIQGTIREFINYRARSSAVSQITNSEENASNPNHQAQAKIKPITRKVSNVNTLFLLYVSNTSVKKLLHKIKYVAYSSQGSHTGQLEFCNWLTDDSTTG